MFVADWFLKAFDKGLVDLDPAVEADEHGLAFFELFQLVLPDYIEHYAVHIDRRAAQQSFLNGKPFSEAYLRNRYPPKLVAEP